MRPKGSSARAGLRLTAMAAAGVLLPVGLLSVLQYRSLVELHAQTQSATQESLRQRLHAVARKAEERIQRIALDALLPLKPADVRRDRAGELGRQFAAIRNAHPEVGELFVVSQCDCPGGPFAVVAAGQGARIVDCSQEGYDGVNVGRTQLAFRTSQPMWMAATGRDEFTAFQRPPAADPRQGAVPTTLFVFRSLSSGRLARSDEMFAGLTLRPEYLSDELLPAVANEVLGRAAVSLRVIDDRGLEVWGSGAKPQREEVTAGFGPLLPLWGLSIGYRGTTIEELARQQLWRNFALAGIVVAVLIAGVALMLRAAARETRLAELKSAFVANISHEMKTPLALIRVLSETLELGRIGSREKLQEYYRILHRESRRLSGLIDGILDFARMESGRAQYQFAPADLAGVVEDVVRSYEEQIVGAGFELRVDIQRPLPPMVMDAAAVSQAVLNILSNAVKYSGDVKKITVRVAQQNGHLGVEISDHGIGIPKREHRRIFEKFYRVGDGLVHDTKGSGLGLTLSQHIVEAHGGRILVDSAPGRGSRFTMLLPAQPPAAGAPQVSAGEPPLAESADYRG